MEGGLMRDDRPTRRASPFHRPGMPGFVLKTLREAAGLSRLEAMQLCNLSVPTIKSIELYDDGDVFVWSAMESRYRLVLDGCAAARR